MVEHIIADHQPLSGAWRMDRIMQDYPAAHRALIESFGIQRNPGPQGPGYQPADSLDDVAARHGVDTADAIARILQFHARAQEIEITVQETVELGRLGKVVVLDVREPQAFAMAHVPESRCIDAALAREIITDWPRDTPMVLVCHHGMRSLDATEYFRAQGFTNTRSLRGGVDAWSIEIDPAVPRY